MSLAKDASRTDAAPFSSVPSDVSSDAACGATRARRAYAAPVLTAFGSVEEFTRGTGSRMVDSNRTGRMATGAAM
jgi:hypothetical protein